ncbi:MAG: PAS domain-containing protein [Chitinivibrionales bacterium]|nr:PAS domain-containing protein [Chitinivibrionales bacterium]MBD3356448.1 PAS domain-containing protein [Chitinivibrionales bacterium]
MNVIGMNEFLNDLFILMINLSQIRNESTIVRDFLAAMNSFDKGIKFRIASNQEYSSPRTIRIATAKHEFGKLMIDGSGEEIGEPQLSCFRNAARILALILENTEQERLLEEESLRLESAVRERTASLEASLEHFRRAQRSAHVGSWEWNIHTNRVLWSDQIFPIFGLSPKEFDGTFEAVAERVHPEDFDCWRENVRTCIEDGKEHAIDFRIVRPDGTIRWVGAYGDTERDAGGRPLCLTGVAMDITERKIAETKLNTSL